MILPIALTTTGAAAAVNFWLALRIAQVRGKEKIMLGDGGHPALIARMRAQLNFAEYTPIVLVLIALVEFASGTSLWLWIVAAIYLLGRLLHAFGMDGWMPGRAIGIAATQLIMLGLAGYAIYLGATYQPPASTVFSVGRVR